MAVDGIVREFLNVQFRRQQQAVPVVAAGCAVCDPAHVVTPIAPIAWQLGYSRFRPAAASLLLRHRRPPIQTNVLVIRTRLI